MKYPEIILLFPMLAFKCFMQRILWSISLCETLNLLLLLTPICVWETIDLYVHVFFVNYMFWSSRMLKYYE